MGYWTVKELEGEEAVEVLVRAGIVTQANLAGVPVEIVGGKGPLFYKNTALDMAEIIVRRAEGEDPHLNMLYALVLSLSEVNDTLEDISTALGAIWEAMPGAKKGLFE